MKPAFLINNSIIFTLRGTEAKLDCILTGMKKAVLISRANFPIRIKKWIWVEILTVIWMKSGLGGNQVFRVFHLRDILLSHRQNCFINSMINPLPQLWITVALVTMVPSMVLLPMKTMSMLAVAVPKALTLR